MSEQAAREAAFIAWWQEQEEYEFVQAHGWTVDGMQSHDLARRAWAACEAQHALTEAQRDLLLLGLDRVLRWGEQLSSEPTSPTHVPQMVKQLRDILESMPSLEAVRAAREGQDG
jgi:hypothetical protein